MDYRKLDSSLAMAIDAEGRVPQARDMLVLVRLTEPPSPPQLEHLQSRGVDSAAAPGRAVMTGTLSREDVETLSEQPWVLSLTLSATRNPT
ncbi:hypothetical protein OG453_28670 [Streptomyces sp. NBC_01381]|uniref:hypothetical protein n=1 Tax=Streptomyces sp. NBC_01381 TaxID=2903845 RepID=UPI00225A498A|nr:hypothetical protein [Streptomyces sp. NBC_01381]MCX4670619.1 hypothetical protein [Streptomyces sp. NBC_01381]